MGGAQCRNSPQQDNEYCTQHSREASRVHGRIDGPVPSKKLDEFLRYGRKRAVDAAASKDSTDSSCEAALVRKSRAKKKVFQEMGIQGGDESGNIPKFSHAAAPPATVKQTISS